MQVFFALLIADWALSGVHVGRGRRHVETEEGGGRLEGMRNALPPSLPPLRR